MAPAGIVFGTVTDAATLQPILFVGLKYATLTETVYVLVIPMNMVATKIGALPTGLYKVHFTTDDSSELCARMVP